MADWSILKSSGNDFLSSLTTYSNHDPTLTQFHMMSSFIDRTFSSQNIYNENTFCTPDNVDECLTHLNQELTGLGLQPVSRDGVGCTTSLINRLEEILRMYQRSNRIKEELENRVHRISCDASENQSVIRRLKNDKERLERGVAQEKEQHRQTHNKIKNLSTKLKTEKDELRRVQSVVKDRDAQYKHELKKKQREVNRLMEKLHQLLMDKNPDRRIGMDMEGYLRRGDSKRSTWKNTATSNKQEEMYQLLISNYEEKQQELRVENSDLRDCLIDMQKELSSVLNTSNTNMTSLHSQNGDISASSSEEDLSTSSSISHDLNDDYFQMPYDLLRENLQKSFQGTCKRLRQNMKKCSSNTQSSPKSHVRQSSQGKSPLHHVDDNRESERRQEEMEKLRKQIDKYKDIVKQQEELIQQSLSTQSRSMENTFLQESQILQEKESLSEQRRKFYQEKANFEEERRKNAEISRQIQHERKQLEEEKASLLRTQIIHMSPYSSSKPPTPPKSKDKTRLLPSTPVFSPAPGKSNSALTSSAELLKMLSLSKKKSVQNQQK
ncbi:afadin- and alpha-actinin-binding protein B-like isoform X2 [Mercenaria mercenaria]|uniref:afadin- and alpha-actinin-binding protein B-like isoform X2 n=1 Tax=Mercenaria mercenaria TaxID=6596 RepID=UPI00234E494E|nr:afadin- and alpha-actinin-binding protein B-like isoform X2 [Mercenaria mercenaria]